MPGGEMNIKAEGRIFRGDNCHFVDNHFLSVFNFPLLAGERSNALKDPYTVVLTEKVAKKYFGVHDGNYEGLIGKVLYWGLDPQPYKVTGICADVPENSHIQFDVLVSYNTLITPKEHDADDSWRWSDMRHYLVLKPGADYKTLESKFDDFSDRYFKGDKVSGSVEKFYLQPLRDAHLYSDYEYDIAKTASGKAVWAMLIVAGFILMIAWINYINLTTSRALDRAKEVGLRKVMGAFKSQLVKQFIFESLLITTLAIVVALVIVQVSQGTFNLIIGGNLSLWRILTGASTTTVLILVAITGAGILLSGFYPAFVLSSYQPVTVLKGKFQRSGRGNFLRKALVVFQFTSSAALISGTMIVSQQLRFMNDADLGINIQNTMIVNGPELTKWDSTFIQRVESYRNDLLQVPGVVNATTSGNLPGDRLGRAFGIRLSDQPSSSHYTMSQFNADYNFLDTYRIKVLAGRKFLPGDHKVKFQDLNTVILNLNAVKLLGLDNAESAVGKELIWGDNSQRKWYVVGVVDNFHQQSLKTPMEPMIFRPVYSTYNPTSVKFNGTDRQRIVADVEKSFQKFFPDNAFEYFFLEDSYNRQYRDDNRFGTVIGIFTGLAIIISCLGLIGLSSYTAVQRTKEIGIRKVLGASRFSIVSLLSVDFIKLVLFASVLSLPVAFIATHRWLETYAYRITVGWALFLLPVLLILVIAALTIGFQVMKTAMTNPAETLKYE